MNYNEALTSISEGNIVKRSGRSAGTYILSAYCHPRYRMIGKHPHKMNNGICNLRYADNDDKNATDYEITVIS